MTLAAEPMTRKVFVVPPEISLSQVWALMCRGLFRHLPVVSGGALIGLLPDRDILLRATLKDGRVCVPDTDVCDLVRVMTEKRIDAVPVVEGTNRLVGLVTSTDLLLLLIRLDEAKIPLPSVFELEQHHAGAGSRQALFEFRIVSPTTRATVAVSPKEFSKS